MGEEGHQDSHSVDDLKLQVLLMERAERLNRYVKKRIPADVRRVLAPEDVLQEVWLAAFRGISSFRLDGPDAFDRWLTRITGRKLLDAIRDARRLKRGGRHRFQYETRQRKTSFLDLFARVTARQRTPSSEIAASEAVHTVQIALCTLPDDHRHAIAMCHIHGRSRADAAKAMGKTSSAVNGLLYRGLRLLRERLGPATKFFSNGS